MCSLVRLYVVCICIGPGELVGGKVASCWQNG